MDDSDEEYIAPHQEQEASPGRSVSNDPDDELSDDGMSKRTRSNGNSRGVINSKLKGGNGYSWEDEYQRSWDIVKNDEDDSRSLESVIQAMIESRKKKIMKHSTTPFQRGIIRTLIVIIDCSAAMLEKDLRPTRFSMTLSLLLDFVVEFFDQNPISQLGIVMMRNGVSQLVSEVSGLPQYHLDRIRQVKARQHNRYEPKGDPSLQNALEMARSLLTYNFGNNNNDAKNSKELLIIFGALFTSDPGDIHKTIDLLVKDQIKVKVIGLSAQVAICQEIVNRTNHQQKNISSNYYGVIMNENHFKELLMDCVIPLPIAEQEIPEEKKEQPGVALIRMGFPSKIQSNSSISAINSQISVDFPQLCACHPTNGSNDSKNVVEISYTNDMNTPSSVGYQCPQCFSKVCHLPCICPVCGLMLILSTHLARSFHHLVPLRDFKEIPVASSYESSYCYGCLLKFPEGFNGEKKKEKNSLDNMTSSRYRCPKCSQDFCIDCDVFIHESLHNCPGCENN